MRRPSALLLGLLLSVNLGPPAQAVTIYQPRSASISSGNDVMLDCTWDSAFSSSIGRYTWYYHHHHNSSLPGTVVSNKTGSHRGRVVAPKMATFAASRKAGIKLRDVRVNDSGLYICEVEIFNASIGRGNGILLQVVDGSPTRENEAGPAVRIPFSVILLVSRTVGVLLFFSLTVLFINCYYARI